MKVKSKIFHSLKKGKQLFLMKKKRGFLGWDVSGWWILALVLLFIVLSWIFDVKESLGSAIDYLRNWRTFG